MSDETAFICFIILILLLIFSIYEYKIYKKTHPDYCETPMMTNPEGEQLDTFAMGYKNDYFKDNHFEGYVTFTKSSINILETNKEETLDITVGEYVESVEYLNGLLYVTRADIIDHEGELLVFDIKTLEQVDSAIYDKYVQLFKFNETLYGLSEYDGYKLYELTDNLELTNGVSMEDYIYSAVEYNDPIFLYLVMKMYEVNYWFTHLSLNILKLL